MWPSIVSSSNRDRALRRMRRGRRRRRSVHNRLLAIMPGRALDEKPWELRNADSFSHLRRQEDVYKAYSAIICQYCTHGLHLTALTSSTERKVARPGETDRANKTDSERICQKKEKAIDCRTSLGAVFSTKRAKDVAVASQSERQSAREEVLPCKTTGP